MLQNSEPSSTLWELATLICIVCFSDYVNTFSTTTADGALLALLRALLSTKTGHLRA